MTASYLELGQLERARRLLDELAQRSAKEDHADPRFAYALMAHQYLTDADAWDHLDEILKPIASHLPLEAGEAEGSLGCGQHAPGAALATRYPVGVISQQRAQWLRAEAAMRRGDEAGVRAALEAAKPIEEAMEPWRPLLGAQVYERRKATQSVFLLGARAYHDKSEASGALAAEALAAFDAVRVKHPKLSRALLGAARAARAAGLPDVAHDRYAELAALWADADADLPAVREVRAAAQQRPTSAPARLSGAGLRAGHLPARRARPSPEPPDPG